MPTSPTLSIKGKLECPWSNTSHSPVRKTSVKARSHGAIFLFVTAMQKMDCVDVNEGVHMVRFHVRVMHWCVRCHT